MTKTTSRNSDMVATSETIESRHVSLPPSPPSSSSSSSSGDASSSVEYSCSGNNSSSDYSSSSSSAAPAASEYNNNNNGRHYHSHGGPRQRGVPVQQQQQQSNRRRRRQSQSQNQQEEISQQQQPSDDSTLLIATTTSRAKNESRRMLSSSSSSISSLSRKHSYTLHNHHHGRRGQQQHRRRHASSSSSSSSSSCKKMWFLRTVGTGGTALLIGLVICLLDIFYFVDYVERTIHNNHRLEDGKSKSNSKKKTFEDIIQPIVFTTTTELEQTTKAKEQEAVEAKKDNKNNNHDDDDDRGPILDLLRDAGISLSDLDDETMALLPTWSQVTALYGNKPIIHGLNDGVCEAFQDANGDPAEHFVSVAGTFNTGTNLLSELLIHNCVMPHRQAKYGVASRGVRWQVPWGKHTPVHNETFRLQHRAGNEGMQVIKDARQVFAAVTIRDPATWMASMCRHSYAMHWTHNNNNNGQHESSSSLHCPNLVPNEMDIAQDASLLNAKSIPVSIEYAESFTTRHDSMLHHYNKWYQDYLDVKWPRLIVRFEDVIFHPKQVTRAVCECAGGQLNAINGKNEFMYIVDSAKKGGGAHGQAPTGYIQSIIKYGNGATRWNNMTVEDINFVHENMDMQLMNLFGYQMPPKPPPPKPMTMTTDATTTSQ